MLTKNQVMLDNQVRSEKQQISFFKSLNLKMSCFEDLLTLTMLVAVALVLSLVGGSFLGFDAIILAVFSLGYSEVNILALEALYVAAMVGLQLPMSGNGSFFAVILIFLGIFNMSGLIGATVAWIVVFFSVDSKLPLIGVFGTICLMGVYVSCLPPVRELAERFPRVQKALRSHEEAKQPNNEKNGYTPMQQV